MKAFLKIMLLLACMVNFIVPAVAHQAITPKTHPNLLDKRLAEQMRYSWFICNRYRGFSKFSPLHYCRQCSETRTYDLSFEHHHDFQAWLNYDWRNSPKMVCQRMGYKPRQYHSFTSARAAHRWKNKYCGCTEAMLDKKTS